MDASANHVVIVGGPEVEDELLSMVLDDGKAIPLFDSVEEAETFLASTGEFGKDWRAREVRAIELIEILEYQGEEIEYVVEPATGEPGGWDGGERNLPRDPHRSPQTPARSCYPAEGERRFLARPVRALDGLWG